MVGHLPMTRTARRSSHAAYKSRVDRSQLRVHDRGSWRHRPASFTVARCWRSVRMARALLATRAFAAVPIGHGDAYASRIE